MTFRAAVITFPGSNCDRDMADALEKVSGAAPLVVPPPVASWVAPDWVPGDPSSLAPPPIAVSALPPGALSGVPPGVPACTCNSTVPWVWLSKVRKSAKVICPLPVVP